MPKYLAVDWTDQSYDEEDYTTVYHALLNTPAFMDLYIKIENNMTKDELIHKIKELEEGLVR